MSTPIRREDDAPDDPLRYVPRRPRRSSSVMPELSGRGPAPSPSVAAAPPMAPGIGGPNIELPPFAGDVAIKELRHRLALDPDLVPRPPIKAGRESVLPWIGRFSVVLILASIVGFGATLMLFPNAAPKEPGIVAGVATPLLDGLSHSGTQAQPARLVIEGHTAFANEPIPLGVSLNGGSGGEMLTLVGLATGTRLTAGAPLGPTGWQLSARDIGKAYAYAPRDFVGVMDAAIDLRSPRDRLMDSQIVRLEWIEKKAALLAPKAEPTKPEAARPEPPKLEPLKLEPAKLEPAKPPSAVQQLGPEEIATLIKRGEDFLKYGDVASARLSLRRAASAGNAQAALALGVTFDPAFLHERGILGFAPDVAQARAWYEKAAELGSSDAARRLERLGRRAQ
jgi:hypothetical protein